MILDIDLGNTRAKWRLIAQIEGARVSGSGDPENWLAGDIPAEWFGGVERIRIASVRGAHILDRLVVVLNQQLGISAEVAAVSNVCGGVRNGYLTPANLGVDRWLAMIAAFVEAGQAVMIVDVGSALTIDLVDCGGDHRGGFIIPGPRLMREILTTATDRIRFDVVESKASVAFGRGTADCVLNGATLAIVGSIQRAFVEAEHLLSTMPVLFLTGGYAEILVHVAVFDAVRYRPDLVLDGLCHVLP